LIITPLQIPSKLLLSVGFVVVKLHSQNYFKTLNLNTMKTFKKGKTYWTAGKNASTIKRYEYLCAYKQKNYYIFMCLQSLQPIKVYKNWVDELLNTEKEAITQTIANLKSDIELLENQLKQI
jgi:hypothetical protein